MRDSMARDSVSGPTLAPIVESPLAPIVDGGPIRRVARRRQPAAGAINDAAGAATGNATTPDDQLPTLEPQTVVGDRGEGSTTPTPSGGPGQLDLAPPPGQVTPATPGVGATSSGGTDVGGVGQTSSSYNAPSQPLQTPSPIPLTATQYGGTVRVVTADEIRRSGATQLSDALRGVAGLDVVQQGTPGSITSLFLRGAPSQHTKVLLDGIPINDPSSPARAFDFSSMSIDNVERVEVLQGPQSLLYGSDAIGGVVNIVTQRGSGPPTGGVSLLGGAYSTQREAGYVRGGADWYHYSLSGSWFKTGGYSSAAAGVERDGYQMGTVGGRWGLVLTDSVEVEHVFRWVDSRSEVDDASFSLGQPPTDDPLRLNLTTNYLQRIRLRHAPVDGWFEQSLSFDLTDYEREDRDDLFPFSTTGQTRRLLYVANVLLTEQNVVSAGAEYWAEDATSLGFGSFTEATQHQRSAFVQDHWQIGARLHALAGVRWDDHSAAGTANTYRFVLLGDIFETGTRLKASLGTGFRAPALAENLFPFGNPGLRPETSRGWELGADQTLVPDKLYCGAVYFRNDISNLILFDLATFTLQNIGAASTHGVELTSRWNIHPTWFVDASYTRTDTLDGDTQAPLVRRPRDKGGVSLHWVATDRGSARLGLYAVGRRTDARDGSVTLDPYLLGQLSGSYLLHARTRLTGRVDNLFNTHYAEATGFGVPKQSLYAGIEWSR